MLDWPTIGRGHGANVIKRVLGLVLLSGALLAGCQAPQQSDQTVPAPATKTPVAPTDRAAAKSAPPPAVKTRPFPADSFYDLLVAEVALRRGAYELALDNYLQQALATRDPQVAARAARLAQFLRADRPALAAARLWVELQPDDLEANFMVASQLAKMERPLEAMPYMVTVLEGGATANFAAIAASAAVLDKPAREQLLTQLDRLLTAYPDNVELKTGKALLLQQMGEREQALQLVRSVLIANSTATHALLIETRLLQELGRESEAFTRLEQVVADNPYNRRLRLQYARLLTSADMEKARQQFEILVQQSPYDPDLLLSLALISRETGAIEESRRYFEQLLDMGHRLGEAHYYLGQIAEERGERSAALDHYEQIPPGSEFLPGVGRAIALLLQHDDIAGARQHLADLRNQHPEQQVRLYLIESELLMQQNRFQQGLALLTEALEAYPDHANLLYARSLFGEKLGDLALLEQDLRRILEQDPDNVHALNALGYSLANLSERTDEAQRLVRRAHELKPDDPAILDSLGWIEYKQGNLEQALTHLEQAYAALPDAEVAAHLGEVLWQLQRTDEALAVWLKALRKEPDSAVLRDTLQRYGQDQESDEVPEQTDAR